MDEREQEDGNEGGRPESRDRHGHCRQRRQHVTSAHAPAAVREARTVGREEGPDRLLEQRGGSIDGGHVAAPQLDEHLGAARRPVQPAPLLDRNDLVVCAVQKEDGRGDGADLPNRIERAPHEEPEREKGIAAAGEVHQRGRRPFENERGRRHPRRHVHRDRGAERPAVDDDRVWRHPPGIPQVVVGGAGIGPKPALGGRAGHAAEPAILRRHDVQAGVAQHAVVRDVHLRGDARRVAMQIEHPRSGIGVAPTHHPGELLDPVGSRHIDLLVRKRRPAGRQRAASLEHQLRSRCPINHITASP